MLNLLLNTIITIGLIFSAFNYVPLTRLEPLSNLHKLGSSVTTINGSDTLTSSRTTINDNFSALNSTKIEAATTSVAAITTLANLTSLGTIGTGVWQGTIVTMPYGGTGSSTLSSNQVLLGNGSSAIKTVNGYGSSGQFLTSNGSASAPTWQASAVDQTANYNWTGTHLFKSLNASSTAANPIVLNGVSYSTQSTQGASSTSLRNDSTGALTWQLPGWDLLARNTFGGVATATLSFPVRNMLGVVIRSVGDGSVGNGHTLSFNSYTGALDTIGTNTVLDGVAGTKASSTLATSATWASATTSPFLIIGKIANATSTKKTFTYSGSYESGNFPYDVTGSYIWATTTAQINTINIAGYRWGDTPTSWTSGMIIEIYGGNQQ